MLTFPAYATDIFDIPKEGYVILQFDISKEGKPINIEVIESKPKRIFDREAIRQLKTWKYKPKIVDGVAVIQKGFKVQLDMVVE